jgi:hypothetical protein
MLDEREIRRSQEVLHIGGTPGQEIIDSDNGMTFLQQPPGKIRSNEPCDSR